MERFLLTEEARDQIVHIVSKYKTSRNPSKAIGAERSALSYAEERANIIKELSYLEGKRGLTASLQRLQKTVRLVATGELFKLFFEGPLIAQSPIGIRIDSIVDEDIRKSKIGS